MQDQSSEDTSLMTARTKEVSVKDLHDGEGGAGGGGGYGSDKGTAMDGEYEIKPG